MTPNIDLSIECERWEAVDGLEKLAQTVIDACLLETSQTLPVKAELSLLFCDDPAIRMLNKTWRNKDAPTNVLSFPVPTRKGRTPSPMLGDIVIAYETTAAEAKRDHKTLRDHTAHLIAHGFLHLMGHDHEIEAEAETMEAAERRILQHLGIADPYQSHV